MGQNDGKVLKQGHNFPLAGQAEAPIKGTLADAEAADNKIVCVQMSVELDLSFFRNIRFFSNLLAL